VKDYYALLEIAPTSSADEVKRAFRSQIARYHPDKVQHLGKEFQAMAAERAAELTEAYRILSDETRRAEYDRVRSTSPAAAAPPPPAAGSRPSEPGAPHAATQASRPPASDAGAARPAAAEGRAIRDDFVRRAVLNRFKQVLQATIGGGYDESEFRGFDVACVPKSKLFGRTSGPRLLGRFVPRVDGAAVADAWTQAVKWGSPSQEEVCVFLMGSGMAPQRELAEAIAKQRRGPSRGGKVILIPIDARDWGAHVPTDAPAVAKSLLAKLRGGQ
jgi:hypothetical protein